MRVVAPTHGPRSLLQGHGADKASAKPQPPADVPVLAGVVVHEHREPIWSLAVSGDGKVAVSGGGGRPGNGALITELPMLSRFLASGEHALTLGVGKALTTRALLRHQ